MNKKIKIGVLTILLLLGFFIPYVYSTISGNFAVSMVDPTNALRFYTMPGDTTNGLWVNVKTAIITSVTSSVTVVQPSAANLNATVVGTRTHNNAVPGATNIGALIGLANAAIPTFVEGDEVLASVDLSGALRMRSTISSAPTSSQVVVTNSATVIKALNTSRYSICIKNHGSVPVYIGPSGVTATTGMILNANDVFCSDKTTGAWYGITSASTSTVGWVEE